MNEFNDWLNEEMRNRGWNMSELARRGDISSGSLANVINGRRNPGPDFCNRIAQALEIPPEEVFRKAKLIDGPPLPQDMKSLREMIEIAQTMTNEEVDEAVFFLKYLIQRRFMK